MKFFSVFFLLSYTVLAQFSPIVGAEDCIAISMNSPLFTSWAAKGTVKRGWVNCADTTLGKVTYGVVEDCFGVPNPAVLSLGDGGSATFEFQHTLFNGDGFDFAIFENGFDDYFLELAFVEVSSDGENFHRFQSQSLSPSNVQLGAFDLLQTASIHNLAGKYPSQWGTPFDLNDLLGIETLDVTAVSHIRIIDVVGSIDPTYASYDANNNPINDPWPTPFESGGFDLDAIGVIHQNPLSVAEYKQELVFPNPIALNGVLQIKSPHLVGQIKLMDTLGKTYAFKNSYALHLDQFELKAGVYILQYEVLGKLIHRKLILNE